MTAVLRQTPSPEEQEQAEVSFRSSLEDVITVVRNLGGYCSSFDDLTQMCELACLSDGQLRLIMRTVLEPEPQSPQQQQGGRR